MQTTKRTSLTEEYAKLGASAQAVLRRVMFAPTAHAIEVAVEDGDLDPQDLLAVQAFMARWCAVLRLERVLARVQWVMGAEVVACAA